MLYRAHISAVCLVYFASLLIVHEREEGVLTLHLPTEPLNIPWSHGRDANPVPDTVN